MPRLLVSAPSTNSIREGVKEGDSDSSHRSQLDARGNKQVKFRSGASLVIVSSSNHGLVGAIRTARLNRREMLLCIMRADELKEEYSASPVPSGVTSSCTLGWSSFSLCPRQVVTRRSSTIGKHGTKNELPVLERELCQITLVSTSYHNKHFRDTDCVRTLSEMAFLKRGTPRAIPTCTVAMLHYYNCKQ